MKKPASAGFFMGAHNGQGCPQALAFGPARPWRAIRQGMPQNDELHLEYQGLKPAALQFGIFLPSF